MEREILQLVTAFTGSLGFGLVFHLRRKLLLSVALGGLLCWGVYLLCIAWLEGLFLSTLIASAFAAFYAEGLARFFKAPATLFLIPTVVPLIPGSTLYYAMSAAVGGDWMEAREFGAQTVQYALGIAIGISLVWAFWEIVRNLTAMMGRRKNG